MCNREFYIRHMIGIKLKRMLKNTKNGDYGAARLYCWELNTLLDYMLCVGDISSEAYEKVMHLAGIVKKRRNCNDDKKNQ